ncbi:hypothetical protein IWQ54_005508 [Labrenzia sp. EL_195]|nr:hypothetical protein [Labrenzia sp. EL_195]
MSAAKSSLLFRGERLLTTSADVGDVRDYVYQPALSGLARQVDPRSGNSLWWSSGRIRDQGDAGSCTAHALAGIIDHLRVRDRMLDKSAKTKLGKGDRKPWASANMLYNIARFHDRFPGENYEGSSIRGALKAFYFNGACADTVAKGLSGREWHMTREILESARKVQLGAYYRVRPRLPDVHAALCEAGLVLASADIHEGWSTKTADIGLPKTKSEKLGRHAFILVGYTERGFLVQNSWGANWGEDGVALWNYEDWASSVVDMWVLRLAVPIASHSAIGSAQAAVSRGAQLGQGAFDHASIDPVSPPTRFDVLGHIASTSRGKLDRFGPYHIDMATLKETVRILAESSKYKHILIHFMGLQRHENATMSALRDAVPVFKKNGVYPFFVTVENDLCVAVHDMVEAEVGRANKLIGLGESPEKDRHIEGQLSGAALRIVEEIRRSSMSVVYKSEKNTLGEGLQILNDLFSALEPRYRQGEISYHMSAHGFGSLLLAELFRQTDYWSRQPIFSSLSLFSPMLPEELFRKSFVERLYHPRDLPVSRKARGSDVGIEKVDLYLQSEDAMREDRPFPGYGGNWPLLWGRVLAMAERRANGGYSGLETGGTYRCENREQARLLALGAPATNLSGEPGVELKKLFGPHRDFDLRTELLDALLDRILNGVTTLPFETAYPDRESLLKS